MKLLGITAEYNPFHNGHRYHIEKSRELTGADYVVAAMSGNFTQRGEPAVLDKWTRSRLAVENGVDLVLELPFVFACSRAERFAKGAVDILAGMGVTHISFGSERGEIEELEALAESLKLHDAEISVKRTEWMKEGYSFAKANELAVRDVMGEAQSGMLLQPNNILAIEYLNRILYWKERGCKIDAVTVKRCGSGYFDADEASGFAGATYIRKTLEELGSVEDDNGKKQDVTQIISPYTPKNIAAAFAEEGGETARRIARMKERCFDLIRGEVLRMDAEALSGIYCMGEGLENRLKRVVMSAGSLDELVSSMVSRRYTEASIRRLLTYVLMGIRYEEPPEGIYGRVLAAGAKGQELLKRIKKAGTVRLPLITNVNKGAELSHEVCETLHYDILASDMYNLLHGRELYAFSDKVITPYMESR